MGFTYHAKAIEVVINVASAADSPMVFLKYKVLAMPAK